MLFYDYFLAASAAKNYEKKAVIKSAASAASAKGGCASSRLDHGLKFYVTQGGALADDLLTNSRTALYHAEGVLQKTQITVFAISDSTPSFSRHQRRDINAQKTNQETQKWTQGSN